MPKISKREMTKRMMLLSGKLPTEHFTQCACVIDIDKAPFIDGHLCCSVCVKSGCLNVKICKVTREYPRWHLNDVRDLRKQKSKNG